MSQPELRLQIQVVHFLRHAMPVHLLWWHTPNGGARNPREGAKLKAMGTQPGVPDLLFLLPDGSLGCIELKARNGRATPEQSEWLLKASTLGARVAVCRTLDQVVDALAVWIAPLQLNARIAA